MKDITPNVQCTTDLDLISRQTGQPLHWVDQMVIDRQGLIDHANMTTMGLHQVVKSEEAYLCSIGAGLTPIEPSAENIDMEAAVIANRHDTPPQHLSIRAKWNENESIAGGKSNALGDNGLFEIDSLQTEFTLPVIKANHASLLYYGALLITENQQVTFPNKSYPIWKMEIGPHYVDQFILTEIGNGFYLEWHSDRPHWHQPLTPDCGGFYLLGRAIENGSGYVEYHLTGFEIPFGTAVYTGLGAIHCDAGLVGKSWNMGYTDSNHFSTALARNREMSWVKFVPSEE